MAVEFLNIDCMEYMRTLPDKAFELAIVYPPYGFGRSGKPKSIYDRRAAAIVDADVIRARDIGPSLKDADRDRIKSQVDEFLARGGTIVEVPTMERPEVSVTWKQQGRDSYARTYGDD